MEDFGIQEMQALQKALHEKYKSRWAPLCPQRAKSHLLWMIGEIGEVIDIVKKQSDALCAGDADVRKHLVEEMADVLMYYNDVTLCYGISPDELKQAYVDKFEKNLKRW